MTLIVGIRCVDGVVIGTDSAITFGSPQLLTIEQPYHSKIECIEDHMLVAGTGPIGLGQRFIEETRSLWKEKAFRSQSVTKIGQLIANRALTNFSSTGVKPGQYGALVAVPCNNTAELIEFPVADLQPEFKTSTNWYASMGSGQLIADPLLGFVRRTFWGDLPPKKQEGIFAATMVLKLACDMAPVGVAPPIQMAVLAQDRKGQLSAQIIAKEALLEHEDNVNEALEYFKKYVNRDNNSVQVPDLPSPTKKLTDTPRNEQNV